MTITEQGLHESTSQTRPASKITRVGNLTREPELRISAKGASWLTTALGVDRRRRTEDGAWEDLDPEFYDVVCFGDLADHVAECLAQGDRVVVVGRLEDDAWTGRDGRVRTTSKLVADDIATSLRYGTVEVNRNERRGPSRPADAERLDRIANAGTADELFGADQ